MSEGLLESLSHPTIGQRQKQGGPTGPRRKNSGSVVNDGTLASAKLDPLASAHAAVDSDLPIIFHDDHYLASLTTGMTSPMANGSCFSDVDIMRECHSTSNRPHMWAEGHDGSLHDQASGSSCSVFPTD